MSNFKPLLAATPQLEEINYPMYASRKIDGFRCCILPMGNAVTRSMKSIPNIYVSGKLEEMDIPYLDGELVTYTKGKIDDFSTIQSKLSTRQGMPDFKFMVFDSFQYPKWAYVDRYMNNKIADYAVIHPRIELVEQILIESQAECDKLYYNWLDEGWEGIMLRSPDSIYKFGRSTVKEAILLKIKPIDDAEALVIGKTEKLHNANEATISALGYQERSSHKENMVPMGVLGSLICQWKGVEFELGTGFTAGQRESLWNDHIEGRVVTFHFQGVGPNGKPRFPRFKGFRFDKAAQ